MEKKDYLNKEKLKDVNGGVVLGQTERVPDPIRVTVFCTECGHHEDMWSNERGFWCPNCNKLVLNPYNY